jgi:hypothetical protein
MLSLCRRNHCLHGRDFLRNSYFCFEIFFVILFGVAGAIEARASSANQITNIVVQNATPTSVDIVWDTALPSTSQVIVARDKSYSGERRTPPIPISTLVNHHRVTVDRLMPYDAALGLGTYYFYVASADVNGSTSTSPGPYDAATGDPKTNLLPLQTAAPDPNAKSDFMVYTYGPTDVYAGSDLYFALQVAQVAGPHPAIYIYNFAGYNNGSDGIVKGVVASNQQRLTPQSISVHLQCSEYNPNNSDAYDQNYDAVANMGYCSSNQYSGMTVRLRTASRTNPGRYSVTIILQDNGQGVPVTYYFNVLPRATATKAPGSSYPPPISGKDVWESNMTQLGHKYCDDANSPVSRDSLNTAGSFLTSFDNQSDAWNYDGGRVYQQIESYTNDPAWNHCALTILDPYRQWILANNAGLQLDSTFPYGMAMNYWRTGDDTNAQAIQSLATNGQSAGYGGWVDPYFISETAHAADVRIANELITGNRDRLLAKNVDKLLGSLDMVYNGQLGGAHPFMVGLAMEAAIHYYEMTVAEGRPDYRIPPTVKRALDALWRDYYVPSTHAFRYTRWDIPTFDTLSVLNDLVAPAYAWYWNLTGDNNSQSRGDDLFQHTFDVTADVTWSGKQFSEIYKWSFDYVRYRSGLSTSTVAQDNNPLTGLYPDTEPPIETQVAVTNITNNSATIAWNTYENADSQVIYGLTKGNYPLQSQLLDTAPGMKQTHSVTLTALPAGTTYHYRVNSRDAAANLASLADATFTTTGSSDGGGAIGDTANSQPTLNHGAGGASQGGGESYVPPTIGEGTATIHGQSCTITSDSAPPLLQAGGVHQFTAASCPNATWSLSGPGSIDSTGKYTAPSIIHPQSVQRSCQLLPQNSAYYLNIRNAPVHERSVTWMGRIHQFIYNDGTANYNTGHHFGFAINILQSTIVNHNSLQQNLHFLYEGGEQEGLYYLPEPRVARRQNGVNQDPVVFMGGDEHMFTVNTDDCSNQEIYELSIDGSASPTSIVSDGGSNTLITYNSSTKWKVSGPVQIFVDGATGAWSSFNNNTTGYSATILSQDVNSGKMVLSVAFDSRALGKAPSGIRFGPWIGTGDFGGNDPTVNVVGASRWSPATNAVPAGNGADAAGSNMHATSLNMQEWQYALQQCTSAPCINDVGHAIRTTLDNRMISTRNMWPAVNVAWPLHEPLPVIAATATNPSTLTVNGDWSQGDPCADTSRGTNYSIGYPKGCTFPITIVGATGDCAALNGNWTATQANGNTQVTVPTMGCRSINGGVVAHKDWAPYGTRFRLRNSYDPSVICNYKQWSINSDPCKLVFILYNTLKNYGLMILDGTVAWDDWDSGAISGPYLTDAEAQAVSAIGGYNATRTNLSENLDQYFDVVDTSAYQITTDRQSVNWMASTANRVTVTATSFNGRKASQDVLLQGIAVGIEPERIAVAQGISYQPKPWVSGTSNQAVTYSMSPQIAGVTLSSTGLITVGNISPTAIQTTTVTITSAADPTAQPVYLMLDVVPVASDRVIRVTFGQQNYTDSHGKIWYGTPVSRGWWSDYASNPVVGAVEMLGSWYSNSQAWQQWGNPDTSLYNHSVDVTYDIMALLAVPNGNYAVTVYGEPGCTTNPPQCSISPGTNVFDFEVQGAVVAGYQDAYTLAGGKYVGYTIAAPMKVTDGLATVVYRGRSKPSLGVSMSSMMIAPQ